MDVDSDSVIDLASRRKLEKRLKENQPKRKGFKKYKGVRGQPTTDKQELYAQRLAAGEPFIEAFKQVYDCSNMQPDTTAKYASRMKNHLKIRKRVEELKAQIRRALDAQLMGLPAPTSQMPECMAQAVLKEATITGDVVISQQYIIKEQLKNMQGARDAGQFSAAVAAMDKIAKITGFDSDDREKQVTGELERMSAAELKAYIREELSKSGHVIEGEGLGQLVDMRPVEDKG